MEDDDHWSMPLKLPATEVIDLLTDEEDTTIIPNAQPRQATRDASEETAVDEDGEEVEATSSIWEDIVDSAESDGPDYEGEDLPVVFVTSDDADLSQLKEAVRVKKHWPTESA